MSLIGIKGSDATITSIQQQPAPATRPESVFSLLMRLNHSDRPGLTEAEFAQLFARCDCGLVVTRRVFHRHECAQATRAQRTAPGIIDLTVDSDE